MSESINGTAGGRRAEEMESRAGRTHRRFCAQGILPKKKKKERERWPLRGKADFWADTKQATVNPGLGGNTAYEGIARFTNGLMDLLRQSPQPTSEQLTEVFRTYEEAHRPRAELVVKLSGMITRYEAQDTWYLKTASRWLIPWVSDVRKADTYVSFSRNGPCLAYLPDPDVREGDAVEAKL